MPLLFAGIHDQRTAGGTDLHWGSMFPTLDQYWSTRHQYGTEVFLGNKPLLLRESKPVLHGEFWKHPGEHKNKY